jgi:type IV secretion system protein VirB10
MSASQPTPTDALRLRSEHPSVMRLSRKVLAGLGTIAGLGIGGALIYALHTTHHADQPAELYGTDNRATADGLANLPRDYASIPRLGPALPGDLGRPILAAQARGASVPVPEPAVHPDPAEQRRLQEMEDARTSRLFSNASGPRPATTRPVTPATAEGPPSAPGETPPLDPGAMQNMQDRKLAFVNGPTDRRTVSPDRLADPASPYVVQAGAVIPAALITGIRSDLPGQVTAQVTQNVYDSPSGRYLLIPQGARLIGQYDSQVAFGQSRVLLVWTRLIMPNGTSIVLERQPGADAEGYAGLEDGVDYHWGRLFMAAGLSTLLGVGAELSVGDDDSSLVRALRRGSQDTFNQSGQQIVRQQVNVQPTLTVRPGFPVRVIVNRDLVLAPYRS